MGKIRMPEDIGEMYSYAIAKAREDRPKYFNWIKDEIQILIQLINKYDKIFVLGAIGSKLIRATPTFYNQFLEAYQESGASIENEYELLESDDQSELLLEYAMSIATAEENRSKVVPNQSQIDKIYNQLSKIKQNISFWELSAEVPADGNEFDHWLRTHMMQNTIHVRGDGYHVHIKEVYLEVFQPHNGFLEQYYGFTSKDIYEAIIKLDMLVYSKIGNPLGAIQSHARLKEWMKSKGDDVIKAEMRTTGKHFIRHFTEANPDLYDERSPDNVISHDLTVIESYSKVFWVIPKSEKEKKIFELFSAPFGSNVIFYEPPKFKGFPLNDTNIKLKPLIKEGDKYYHFSMHLAFRNIFYITEELIRNADAVYFDQSFRGNSNRNSKDNYIENKTKQLFQRLLPNATFYHSLDYDIVEDGKAKSTELDVLGISNDTVYIIEVKAGELNAKHRRGAMKGLKDRIRETINEGSYQCHRALKYIEQMDKPDFTYVDGGKRETLTLDKSSIQSFNKISVTFEHFSSISANLRHLIESGVLSSDFKWTWIVSLYDLMIFADLIENEADYKEYLKNRLALYERKDIEISDEIDILGFFMGNNFPMGEESPDEIIHIVGYKDEIENYYNKSGVGMPLVNKPKRMRPTA
jgi:hypothetical protein